MISVPLFLHKDILHLSEDREISRQAQLTAKLTILLFYLDKVGLTTHAQNTVIIIGIN
jgi:hypothetical protein